MPYDTVLECCVVVVVVATTYMWLNILSLCLDYSVVPILAIEKLYSFFLKNVLSCYLPEYILPLLHY